MRYPLLGRWEDADTGAVLVEQLHVARTFLHRLVGLQFSGALPVQRGLMFERCQSVHTLWMRYAIDVVYLNEDWQIVELRSQVLPWRFAIPQASRVKHVIEVAAGQAGHLSVGQRTRVAQATGVRL